MFHPLIMAPLVTVRLPKRVIALPACLPACLLVLTMWQPHSVRPILSHAFVAWTIGRIVVRSGGFDTPSHGFASRLRPLGILSWPPLRLLSWGKERGFYLRLAGDVT